MTNGFKFRKQVHGYPVCLVNEDCGQYQVFQRPGDFLVRFYPASRLNFANIGASEKIGTYATEDNVRAAIAADVATRT